MGLSRLWKRKVYMCSFDKARKFLKTAKLPSHSLSRNVPVMPNKRNFLYRSRGVAYRTGGKGLAIDRSKYRISKSNQAAISVASPTVRRIFKQPQRIYKFWVGISDMCTLTLVRSGKQHRRVSSDVSLLPYPVIGGLVYSPLLVLYFLYIDFYDLVSFH